MLKTIGSIILWAVMIAITVFIIVTVFRLTQAFLAHTGWEERAEEWGKSLARKKEEFEDKLEEKAELL